MSDILVEYGAKTNLNGSKLSQNGRKKLSVCIDGFALSLKNGTGLSTYSRELAKTLTSHGNDVSVIYGLNALGKKKELKWSNFVQRLVVKEEHQEKILRSLNWDQKKYFLPYLFGLPLRPISLERLDWVKAAGLNKHLPAQAKVYNLSSAFAVSEKYGSTFRRPLSLSLPRSESIDIFHNTYLNPVFMRGVPNVMTLHDLIPLTLPHTTGFKINKFQNRLKACLKKADQIFVISEHTKRDLQRIYEIDDSKIHLTYQSVSVPKKVKSIDYWNLSSVLEKNFRLQPGKYFLFYGALEPKKNVMRILEAAGLTKTSMPLVIAGKDGWLYEKEKNRILEIEKDAGSVKRYQYLPRKQLMYLIKGARAVVFPSLYEGFGLPVLEAMSLGVPVITSNITSLPEVGGEAPLYVDPYNVHDIAQAMQRIADDNELYNNLVKKGLLQAKKFSPEMHYSRLEKGYQKAIDAYNLRR